MTIQVAVETSDGQMFVIDGPLNVDRVVGYTDEDIGEPTGVGSEGRAAPGFSE